MRRVEHTGTVTRVGEDKASVQLQAVEGCGARFRCACCSAVRPEPRELEVERGNLEQGDIVSVAMPAYAGYVSTLLVFVLPMLMFVIGAVVGWALGKDTQAHNLWAIVGGVCGFVLAIALAVVADRRMSNPADVQVRRVRKGDGEPDLRETR